jgi:hypothetical protein
MTSPSLCRDSAMLPTNANKYIENYLIFTMTSYMFRKPCGHLQGEKFKEYNN